MIYLRDLGSDLCGTVGPGSARMSASQLSRQSSAISLKPMNKKRETEFRSLFMDLPSDENLIDTFSCALNKDILIHGRLYLSQSHLCFNANILGWITNVIIPFKDVMSIEKRMTAFVIPNAIQITTLQHKFFFTSFISREQAYQKFMLVWRNALSDKPLSTEELMRSRSLISRKQSTSSFAESLSSNFAPKKAQSGILAETESNLTCDCTHHPHEILLFLSQLSFNPVYRKLVQDTECAELLAMKQLNYEILDCQAAAYHWLTDEFGVRRRKVLVEFALPTPLLKTSALVKANFIDTVLTDQLGRLVVETQVIFDGIPGGSCSASLRQCLVENRKTAETEFTVSCDVMAPEHSWLKESVRAAITKELRRLYREIGCLIVDEEAKKQLGETTIQQIYFDLGAFSKSMRTLLPFILLILALIWALTRPNWHKMTPRVNQMQNPEILQKVLDINLQYQQFIDGCQLNSALLREQIEDLDNKLGGLVNETE